MTAPTLVRVSSTMRRVNDLIWQSLDEGGRTEPVAFFCECAQEGCYRPVWLTPAAYEESRRRPDGAVVAPNHRGATSR